ncbi:MAG: hypothetical protein ATN36_05420 [Epulopiscium sp. Nele67-Bin005]|nr:MAG: hypothetical protein ATN36_05420 [Epulopiscium sp. Nele67-Bin005]
MFEACRAMCILFGVMSMIVGIFKEKCGFLIGGWNTLPQSEKDLYDKEQVFDYLRILLLKWAVLFGVGTGLAYVNPWFGVGVFGVWFVVFIKDVGLNFISKLEKFKKQPPM